MTQANYNLWEEQKKAIKKEVLDAQKKYCQENNLPCFIESVDTCPNEKCKVDILFAITEREASIKHITACPICQRSFTD